MLLAMSFGLSAGWRKTLPLIFGAVCGLACVAFVCGVGVGAIFSANELIFRSFMYACAMYLVYLAFKMSNLKRKKRAQSLAHSFFTA